MKITVLYPHVMSKTSLTRISIYHVKHDNNGCSQCKSTSISSSSRQSVEETFAGTFIPFKTLNIDEKKKVCLKRIYGTLFVTAFDLAPSHDKIFHN